MKDFAGGNCLRGKGARNNAAPASMFRAGDWAAVDKEEYEKGAANDRDALIISAV